jgi:hypothetical protein
LAELLRECADTIGGKNFFLTLAETIRSTREGIIVGEKKQINYTNGTMTWNKTLHADNWRLLSNRQKYGRKTATFSSLPKINDIKTSST